MSSSGRPKIFIVEDNFVFSYVLENVLKEQENYKITTFASGEECIELLDNNPDVIVLDYNLDKKLNGLDTFKIIKSKMPETPVIVLSGQDDVQVAADLMKMGAFDYIEKRNTETAIGKLCESIVKALTN
jgi:DNA-binding NtrC family response regulator